MNKLKTIPVESLIKSGCELQKTLNCMTKLYNTSKVKSTNALANLQHLEDKLWIRKADVLEHIANNHGEEIKTKFGSARLDKNGQVEFIPTELTQMGEEQHGWSQNYPFKENWTQSNLFLFISEYYGNSPICNAHPTRTAKMQYIDVHS